MSDFEAYSTPPPSTPFSKHYFENLSVEAIVNSPSYPTICSAGSLIGWVWAEITPWWTSGSIVSPYETILNIKDLPEIYDGMRQAFSAGSRSVIVKFRLKDVEHQYCYSFSKMNLIRLINNNDGPRRECARLLRYLESPHLTALNIGDLAIQFGQCRFLDPVAGFITTHCQLYKLASLVGERRVHQDIVDCFLELEYFSAYVESAKGNPREPVAPTAI
ncbi:hypothetical protein FA13DRAFT_1607918, partial [Coprinellus micaceus]